MQAALEAMVPYQSRLMMPDCDVVSPADCTLSVLTLVWPHMMFHWLFADMEGGVAPYSLTSLNPL